MTAKVPSSRDHTPGTPFYLTHETGTSLKDHQLKMYYFGIRHERKPFAIEIRGMFVQALYELQILLCTVDQTSIKLLSYICGSMLCLDQRSCTLFYFFPFLFHGCHKVPYGCNRCDNVNHFPRILGTPIVPLGLMHCSGAIIVLGRCYNVRSLRICSCQIRYLEARRLNPYLLCLRDYLRLHHRFHAGLNITYVIF